MEAKVRSKILFVDDEPCFLEGLRRTLRSQCRSWDLVFAHSAKEALAEVRKGGVDVIVSDVRMPEKDGLQLLSSITKSEATKDIPVIILTGFAEDALKRRALALGATDLLSKPVCREDLVARIRSSLRLRAYQRELKTLNQSLERKVEERTRELEESRLDAIWHLAKAGEYRDAGTGNHVVRVGYFSRAIAEKLGLSRDFTHRLFLTSPLHDIGKIGIPDAILLKQGRHTPNERKLMEQHCSIGAEILMEGPHGKRFLMKGFGEQEMPVQLPATDNLFLAMSSTIALTHHERWNGGGYPAGLAGEAIPLESRIVAIADVYDALRSVRPYKPAYPEERTLAIMRIYARCYFDPACYAAFEAQLEDLRAIREQFPDENCYPDSLEEAA